MPPKRIFAITLCLSCAASVYAASPAVPTDSQNSHNVYDLSQADVSKQLNWVENPNAHNLCKGYYEEDLIHYVHPRNSHLVDYQGNQSYITRNGVSKLIGNVIITQYAKQATGDVGYLYRNKKGKPDRIELVGHMHLHSPKELIVAHSGTLILRNRHWIIEHALFRNELSTRNPETVRQHDAIKNNHERLYQLNVWGRSEKIRQDHPEITDFYNTTYTSCQPNYDAWHLHASHIRLDKTTGRGTMHNATLYIKKMPVLWVPYFNFPIDDRRQTGFLNPTYGTSTSNGFDTSFPFYWNLAPNYDTTITPRYMSKRGWQLNNGFRYLTDDGSSGTLDMSWMTNDQQFQQDKQKYISEYGGTPTSYNQDQDLLHSTDHRNAIEWNDNTYFNPYWSAQFTYNHVSDDYYMEDFGNSQGDITQNQLLQQALFNYYGPSSNFVLNMQSYQTLHPLDQANTLNQYSRLPQLDYNYALNENPLGLDMGFGSELANFNQTKNPFDITLQSPTVGQRANLQPTVALPLVDTRSAYVTPRAQYVLTSYQLNRPGTQMDANPSRAIPVFDVHSGVYFDRDLSLHGHHYTQTIEPQIYYLYVPYRNQNNLPLFDTVDNSSPLTFNYDELFDYNRFSGVDRIGDANQMTFALSTAYRERQTGFQRLSASIGQILYFQDRKVLACTNDGVPAPCPPTLPSSNTQNRSPIAGLFTYNIDTAWSLNGNLAYNAQDNQMENQTVSFNYRKDYKHIFNIGYTFARQGDPDQVPGVPVNSYRNNLQQTTVSTSWPVSTQWNALAQWNHNWSHDHLQAYLYGLEYDACCWSARLVVNRIFTGLSPQYTNQYDTRIYLQFALKGFAKLGGNDPSSILMADIPGYSNYFGENY